MKWKSLLIFTTSTRKLNAEPINLKLKQTQTGNSQFPKWICAGNGGLLRVSFSTFSTPFQRPFGCVSHSRMRIPILHADRVEICIKGETTVRRQRFLGPHFRFH